MQTAAKPASKVATLVGVFALAQLALGVTAGTARRPHFRTVRAAVHDPWLRGRARARRARFERLLPRPRRAEGPCPRFASNPPPAPARSSPCRRPQPPSFRAMAIRWIRTPIAARAMLITPRSVRRRGARSLRIHRTLVFVWGHALQPWGSLMARALPAARALNVRVVPTATRSPAALLHCRVAMETLVAP